MKMFFYARCQYMLEDTGRLAMTTDANPLYTLNAVAETVDNLKPPKDGLLHLFRNLGAIGQHNTAYMRYKFTDSASLTFCH